MAIPRERLQSSAPAGAGRARAAPESVPGMAMESNDGRDALLRALEAVLPGAGAMPGRRQGAFVMAAIGNLSLINEMIGFQAGDEVIAAFGARLRGCLRERDCIARYGSNKFGMFLADCEPDQVEFVAGRMIRAVRESPMETSAGAVSANIRLGGVLLPHQAKTLQDTFSGALDALDKARSKRGDSFVLYDSSKGRGEQRKRNIMIVDEVIRALNERRMALSLQPVVRAGGRETAFYECLLRMRMPDGTYVPAADFMGIAEKFGLARMIDHRVVELAVGLLRSAPGLRLSMNVSGETSADPEWLALLRGLAQGDRSITSRMMVEITETSAITDIGESAAFVKTLKELGCQVAIDDFGAGYSSFRNLRALDADMVKIDGSFVEKMADCPHDRFLVRTLADLARNFGMKTVAEWVGDEATARLVEEAGIDFLQGFYFGRPRLVGAGEGGREEAPSGGRTARGGAL